MILFPAIDVQDGKVVRLRQGRFDEVTQYAEDPAETALRWAGAGASWIHLVDLDGARHGGLKNLSALRRVVASCRLSVQAGGGVRSLDDIDRVLEAGAARVVLGTRAIEDPEFLREALRGRPDRILVSLDCVEGRVALRGWREVSASDAVETAVRLQEMGVRRIVYTDIRTDGMLSGPDIPGLRRILGAVRIPLIASGGVAALDHVRALQELEPEGLEGVIVGRALYEGTLDLKEAVALCSPNGSSPASM